MIGNIEWVGPDFYIRTHHNPDLWISCGSGPLGNHYPVPSFQEALDCNRYRICCPVYLGSEEVARKFWHMVTTAVTLTIPSTNTEGEEK